MKGNFVALLLLQLFVASQSINFLSFRSSQTLNYKIDAVTQTEVFDSNLGVKRDGGTTKVTARLRLYCQSVQNSTFAFSAEIFDVYVNGRLQAKITTGDDWSLGFHINFRQSSKGEILSVSYDPTDSPEYALLKIGSVNALNTLISNNPTTQIVEKDSYGIHKTTVYNTDGLVSKQWDETGFQEFLDPNLKKENVKMRGESKMTIDKEGFIVSSSNTQRVYNVGSQSGSKRSEVDMVFTSTANLTLTFTGNGWWSSPLPLQKRSDASATASLFEVSRTVDQQSRKKQYSNEYRDNLESLFGENHRELDSPSALKIMNQISHHLSYNPEDVEAFQTVLMRMQDANTPSLIAERSFFVLSSINHPVASDLMLRFGLKSHVPTNVERTLFSLHFLPNPTEEIVKHVEKLTKEDYSHLLVLGSISSRHSVPSFKDTVRFHVKKSYSSGDLDRLETCMHAISNSESSFSASEIKNFRFHQHPSEHLRKKSLTLFPFLSALSAEEYPFNYTKMSTKSIGGKSISASYSASVFAGSNFNCKQSNFNFKLEADLDTYLSLFGQSQSVLSANAIYGQKDGTPLDSGVFLKVWGKTVKRYQIGALDCQVHPVAPTSQVSYPGFSLNYNVWIGIVPITFSVSAGLSTELSWGYTLCPSELRAQMQVVPEATVSVVGSSSVSVLVAKGGIDLKGTIKASINPQLYIKGQECTVGFSSQLVVKPMEVYFETFVQKRKCEFLWIFKCKNEYYDAQKWLSWSLPESTNVLYNITKEIKL